MIQFKNAPTAVQSLRGTTCPACGDTKRAKQSLCLDCWTMLPVREQQALYRHVTQGYVPAVNKALETLARLGISQPAQTPTPNREEHHE